MGLADRTEFSRAYARHRSKVFASALRVLKDPARAEDVAQEVFMGLWLHPERFDPSRGELGSYLQLLARSRALDAWRAEAAAGRATDRLATLAVRDAPPDDELPGPHAEYRDERTLLTRALRKLPPLQRQAVLLHYWGDLSSSEVAQRMQVPLGTAKSRLRLGLRKTRENLDVAAAA